MKKTRKILMIILILFLLTSCTGADIHQNDKITLKVAIAFGDARQENTIEYYKQWLEEQSGYTIEIVPISDSYTNEYIRLMISDNESNIDAILFTESSQLSEPQMNYYTENGYFYNLNELIRLKSIYLKDTIESFEEYDLYRAIQSYDGNVYYMPALEYSKSSIFSQAAWINQDWLEEIDYSIPETTEEFVDVLKAFQKEFPEKAYVVGSPDSYSTFTINFIMNSFTMCDANNFYFAIDEDNQIYYPPQTQGWRDGLIYCRNLYEEGLIVKENFTYSIDELKGLSNDERNLVGLFTAKEIADILFEKTPQISSYYTVLLPLRSENFSGYVPRNPQMPRVGGVILSSSKYIEETFSLLDLMCSEGAYLAGHYGKVGTDWNYASDGDISFLGELAKIVINNQPNMDKSVDKELVVGPFIANPTYTDTISWKGFPVNSSESMQARVYHAYEPYLTNNYLKPIKYTIYPKDMENFERLTSYTKTWMYSFIIGEEDPNNEADWERYIQGFQRYKLNELTMMIEEIGEIGEYKK